METQKPGKKSIAASKPDGAVVAFRNVTQCFDSLWGGKQVRALSEAAFEVQRGEIFGLLGPAGGGKSTVAGLLTGHWGSTEGSVKIFGRSPRGWLARARVAGLAQGAQPTALAQLLLKNPDLIVLDDPFANMDAAAVTAFKDLIRSLAREGKTIILASRNLSDVKDLCDRVAILANGKVQAVGTLNELLDSAEALPWLILGLPSWASRTLLQTMRAELERGTSPAAHSTPKGEAPTTPVLVGPRRSESGAVLAGLRQAAVSGNGQTGTADAAAEAAEEILARLVKPRTPEAPGR